MKLEEKQANPGMPEEDDSLESSERRKAVTKLAYASPVVAGILFSQRAAAMSSPIPPPPGPPG
ncbi:MAG: hypothetical protein AB8B64_19110 [Granulosicoccus sp.]